MSDTEPMPTWEQVLAEVEADLAERSEHLRVQAARAEESTDRSGRRSVDYWLTAPPAALMMPGPALPELAAMPPVPPELAERIDALRNEVSRLQDELRKELALVSSQYAAVTNWRQRAKTLTTAQPTTPRMVDLSA